MPYPPAPWTLQGFGMQTVHLADAAGARRSVPPEFRIIPTWPGKTVVLASFGRYGPGSVLQYSELILTVPVRGMGQRGLWVTHIYVDSADSLAGGREIWGLPKELVQFEWLEDQVTLRQEGRQVCTLRWGRPRWLWRQRLTVPCFSFLGSDLLAYRGRVRGRLGLDSAQLDVPAESPFAALNLGRALLTVHYGGFHFVSTAPQVVGQR